MPTPSEHKTVQARILTYAQAIGWIFVPREQAEQRRGGTPASPPLSLFFDDLLDAKVREFNPRYTEAKDTLLDQFRHLHNQRLGLIVDLDTKRLSKRFLFNVFNTPHLRVEVAKTSTGSKVKHTSPTKLRAIKVGIPPTLKEQEEIATALATTERKVAVAKGKKAQLQDLFHTLLHELMTAKLSAHSLHLG